MNKCLKTLIAASCLVAATGCQKKLPPSPLTDRPHGDEATHDASDATGPAIAGEIDEAAPVEAGTAGVRVWVGGELLRFQLPLQPEEALEGRSFELDPVSGIRAKVDCRDASCGRASIQLQREGKIAKIETDHAQLRAWMGQVRDNCEVPLFFDEDLAQLFENYPAFEPMIDRARAIRSADVSRVSVSGWSGSKFENLEIEAGGMGLRARETDGEGPLTAALVTPDDGLSGAFVHVERQVAGDLSSVSKLTFELSQEGTGALAGFTKKICADVRLGP